jgi:hypothetical protein
MPRRASARPPLAPALAGVVALGLALSVGGGGACGGGHSQTPGSPLTIRWTFVDGRSCADAGALFVVITPADGASQQLVCADGLGQPLAAGAVAAGPLVLEAITEDGVALYRGEATMPAAPATLAVTLRYVGGAP